MIPNGVDLPELGDDSTLNAPSAAVSAVHSGSPGYAQRIDALGTAHAKATGLRPFAKDRKILLYLGRLHPKKNMANLIRAWNELSAFDPERLLGSSRSRDGIRADMKANLNISQFPRPLFSSARNSARKRPNAIGTCDAFILPSLSEGLPMTVLGSLGPCKTGAHDTGMQSA